MFWLPEWFLQLSIHMYIEAYFILSTKLQRILPRILTVPGPQGLLGTHQMIHRLLHWQTRGSAWTPVIQTSKAIILIREIDIMLAFEAMRTQRNWRYHLLKCSILCFDKHTMVKTGPYNLTFHFLPRPTLYLFNISLYL